MDEGQRNGATIIIYRERVGAANPQSFRIYTEAVENPALTEEELAEGVRLDMFSYAWHLTYVAVPPSPQ
jgi:hypothetical protein